MEEKVGNTLERHHSFSQSLLNVNFYCIARHSLAVHSEFILSLSVRLVGQEEVAPHGSAVPAAAPGTIRLRVVVGEFSTPNKIVSKIYIS